MRASREEMAFAETRLTGSLAAWTKTGTILACHRSGKDASKSWHICPRAKRAACLTRQCASCAKVKSKVVIPSIDASLVTNSPAARMAIQAANRSCHLLPVPYCCRSPSKAVLVASKPIFFTKKKTFASPVPCKLSSSSSSSSSSTSSHEDPASSTSLRKTNAMRRAFSGRLGMAFRRPLVLPSIKLEMNSKAKERRPSGRVPLALAYRNIISAHSL
mmetsp:Transcript_6039/g.13020  ORF Transcript_6039/g.13020 Transcript_6039/m.13020 type:complete len:217 (-) Transcript_6039:1005-1655(-)